MMRWHGFWIATLMLLLAAQFVLASQSTVVLSVEGMT
jgi:hypothetical protein